MTRFRVMTYNVHRCLGPGGNDSVEEITSLCREAEADLVALQELDAPETDDMEGVHHARDLASALSMQLLFCRTFRRGVGYYGHALLSRHPIELVKVTTFPAAPKPKRGSEPRGAIWARVRPPSGTVDVISTHLGLYRGDRALQSRELVGPLWLGSPNLVHPVILCGDLNAVPHATTYRRLASVLKDAQKVLAGHSPRPTFPSQWPVLRIDHVFVSDDVIVHGVRVPRDARARRASDHLPLVVDLDVHTTKRKL